MDIKITPTAFKTKKQLQHLSAYKLEKQLGFGAGGEVSQVVDSQGMKRALKRIPKCENSGDLEQLNEVRILQQLDHPNILKLYEFYENQIEYVLITDFWDGGDLYEYMGNHPKFTEKHLAEVLKQLFSILKYIHEKKIVHRDIKSENILVKDTEDGILIKLIDWGIATTCETPLSLAKAIGTPYYMAPEVFKQTYDHRADLWSAGVLLYEMVVGELPFYARLANEVQRLILDTKPLFEPAIWKGFSPDLLDLAQRLLQRDPNKRISAAEALEHPFMVITRKRSKSDEFNSNMLESINRLKQFKARTRLQQAAFKYIAGISQTDEDEKKFMQVFTEIDANCDGRITVEELTLALRKLFNTPEVEAQLQSLAIMDSIDLDRNGCLDYSEFVMACSRQRGLLTEGHLREAFRQFDLNEDGQISADELKQVLVQSDEIEEQKWRNLIAEADTDGDGQISYEEFVGMMQNINNE